MKKILLSMIALMLAFTTFAADRNNVLKVYNWADYIDMDNVLNKFPEWYREQTGEEVSIVYQTFDINESMLTQIEIGHEDYDVICPSEYIIERMLKKGLLLPINKDFGETPDYTKNVAPFAQAMFNQMSDSVTTTDYAVGYMWGTTGLLYNKSLVNKEDIQSWGCLLDPKFQNHIFMKDAFRDIYSVVVLYAYRDEIASGEVTRAELIGTLTPERIQRVEEVLLQAKDNILGWEVDFGKEEMTKGKTLLNVSWSGDAAWAINEAKEVGVDLGYLVPEEGSNVWFDGWCIPKYAVNTKAASYFIDYMCMPENAILNMEEIGYVSVIASPEIMEWANDSTIEETANLTYFFGDGAEAVHANQVYYPDQTVIDHCALMHDCADNTEDMLAMWARVKGDNLSSGFLIFMIAVALAIVAFVVYRILAANKKKNTSKKRKQSRK